MPRKLCPYCEEMFEAVSQETESCRKPACVKANQRKKKREALGVTEVKRGRPKSHVVLLKERTKERIRKAQGPSSTPKTELPQGPDVPPAALDEARERLEDATAGLPPEALPELKGCEHGNIYIPAASSDALKHFEKQVFPVTDPKKWPPIVQHHGTENDLARSIISKVPATKLDPNSPEAELARLEKSQLRNTKKKD